MEDSDQRPTGLYRSADEHDACGVGFVVDIKGRRSHAIVRAGAAGPDQPAAPRRVRLRGRTPATAPASYPDAGPVPPRKARRRLRAAAAGRVRRRARLPAARRPAQRAASRRSSSAIVEEEGQTLLGWRDVPTDDCAARRDARSRSSRSSSSSSSAAARTSTAPDAAPRFERKLYVIRKRVEHAVDAARRCAEQQRFFYIVSLSSQHAHLQGHADAPTRSSRCSPT